MAVDTTEFRKRQRAVWSAGDWPDVATTIQPVSDELIAEAEISDGTELLDVGCGTGNVGIPAAKAGAKVTGVDVTPELFDAGRARAKKAGVEMDWVEGDAADLPFEDGSFDRVLSVFGAMFAPVHQQTADELARVCRPGGMILNCGWTPEGINGRMFITCGSMLPPPPEGVEPPVLWGDEDHVRKLFKDKDVELDFERRMAVLDIDRFDIKSAEDWIAYAEEKLGPVVMARAALSQQGKWDELRGKLVELFREQETDDGIKAESEYLRSIIRPAG